MSREYAHEHTSKLTHAYSRSGHTHACDMQRARCCQQRDAQARTCTQHTRTLEQHTITCTLMWCARARRRTSTLLSHAQKITHHVAWARLQSTTRMTVTRARPHAHVAQHTHGAHMTNARKCMNVPARQCGMYTHAQVSTANARTLAHASVTRTHHVHDGAVHTATTAARCTNARATARHVQRTAHQLHIRTH